MAELEPRKKRALAMFTNSDVELSCNEITKALVEQEMPDFTPEDHKKFFIRARSREISGSVSSILHSLVESGALEYSERKTSRGGHIYKKNPIFL